MISSRSNVKFSNSQEGDVLLELNALRINRPNFELTLEEEYVSGLKMMLLTAPEYTSTEQSSLCFETT
jgi:hypothetical protein